MEPSRRFMYSECIQLKCIFFVSIFQTHNDCEKFSAICWKTILLLEHATLSRPFSFAIKKVVNRIKFSDEMFALRDDEHTAFRFICIQFFNSFLVGAICMARVVCAVKMFAFFNFDAVAYRRHPTRRDWRFLPSLTSYAADASFKSDAFWFRMRKVFLFSAVFLMIANMKI